MIFCGGDCHEGTKPLRNTKGFAAEKREKGDCAEMIIFFCGGGGVILSVRKKITNNQGVIPFAIAQIIATDGLFSSIITAAFRTKSLDATNLMAISANRN